MIKLYSTHCPKCNQLKMVLDKKGLDYKYITDFDEVMDAANKFNVMSAPFIEVDGSVMAFEKAIDYINSLQ